jgi:hypothetical protein
MACHHVFALHDAKEKWQGGTVLESGRKPPRRWWPARLGARINSSCRSGEVQRDADDRCSSSHTDGRTIILSRYTQPEADFQLLLKQLKLELPDQPPPKITASGQIGLCSEDFLGNCVDFERLTIDVPLESAKSG